jgi:flagellar biosynthetic protein FliR
MFEFLYYTDSLSSFMLVVFRVAAILMSAPFFGSNIIRPHIRFVFSVLIAFIIFPGVTAIPFENFSLGILMVLIFKEVLIGVCIGVLSHFLFIGAQLGGQVAGMQMGFSIVNVMDPSSDLSLSIIGSFLNIAMLLLFISAGGHYLVLGAVSESFRMIPLGEGNLEPFAYKYIVDLFSYIFLTAVKITAPVIITLLIFSTIFGVIGKLVPQMNLMMVGIPMKIAIGLYIMAISMKYFYIVYEKMLHRYFEEIANIIRLF